MNVVFLTMVPMTSLSQRSIYQDLLRFYVSKGHNVFIVYPSERRSCKQTIVFEEDGAHFLGVRTLNLRQSSVIEKGVGQVLVEGQFQKAIKKFWGKEHFDLILYSTPPITLIGTIRYLKNSNPQAITYLLLKDIFPQNAVDLGMLSKKGFKGMLYRYFRNKEKQLYGISDHIGCMSPANVEYVLKNNPEVLPDKVEVAPNSLDLIDTNLVERVDREAVRIKYGLPAGKPVFIYGGNLGKPQGIPFLIECLEANASREDCFFVVIGSGTELPRLKQWFSENRPRSVKIMDGLPKNVFSGIVQSCDVGLVFLDHRFTIPNFPSRLLSYLENRIPVLCATDSSSDMGRIAEENGFGFWCESNSVMAFTTILDKMIHSDRVGMGEKGYQFLCENYLVEYTYNAIMKHV